MDTHNIKPKINYMKLLDENTLIEKVNKQTSKQTKVRGNKNYITQNIIIIIIINNNGVLVLILYSVMPKSTNENRIVIFSLIKVAP
jgi:hypothetical protein